MSKMYPDKILRGKTSNAEIKAFNALKNNLPDEFTVIHGLDLLHRSREGEADFIILHPDKGLIVIEVKGGGIEYDSNSGVWSSTDREGTLHKIKDPYKQAQENRHMIGNIIKEELQPSGFNCPYFHGVWFTDIDFDVANMREVNDITLDKNSFEELNDEITQIFYYWLKGKEYMRFPGVDGIEKLLKILVPSWKMSIKLSDTIKEELKEINELTKSQFKVLSLLQRHKKALICGPAGTGKTFLAIEKTMRLIDEGKKNVLLVCYNRKLSDHLQNILSDYLDKTPNTSETTADSNPTDANKIEPTPSAEVCTFHRLCTKYAQQANEYSPRGEHDANYYFDELLPNMLMKSIPKINKKIDALIVDEGQDFKRNWWPPLKALLKGNDDDIIYIFFDDNQNIFGGDFHFPIKVDPFLLEENCRNTNNIHQVIGQFYRSKYEISYKAIGPEGHKPNIIKLKKDENEKLKVEEIVKDLIENQGIHHDDIIILTPKSQKRSIWKEGEKIYDYSISWFGTGPEYVFDTPIDSNHDGYFECIECSSIFSYKGMEKPVVILTEIEGMTDELRYIAVSRASSHLIVLKH